MARINGEDKKLEPISIYDYLVQEGYHPEKVVVELNLEIIPKTSWKDILLQDEDAVEILSFVGGG